MEWRCGKCGKVYGSLLGLKSVKAVDSDTDPKKEHGFVAQCSCGYTFHKDKWFIKDTIEIEEALVEISTVDLELEHFGNWFETMVFIKDSKGKSLECGFQDRYKTKEEAELGHEEIIRKLKAGRYRVVPSTYGLEING